MSGCWSTALVRVAGPALPRRCRARADRPVLAVVRRPRARAATRTTSGPFMYGRVELERPRDAPRGLGSGSRRPPARLAASSFRTRIAERLPAVQPAVHLAPHRLPVALAGARVDAAALEVVGEHRGRNLGCLREIGLLLERKAELLAVGAVVASARSAGCSPGRGSGHRPPCACCRGRRVPRTCA